MAGLFVRDRTVIGRHIRNVFAEGEFAKESNLQYLHIANSDKPASLFSLDVIISVGYRVKSNPPLLKNQLSFWPWLGVPATRELFIIQTPHLVVLFGRNLSVTICSCRPHQMGNYSNGTRII